MGCGKGLVHNSTRSISVASPVNSLAIFSSADAGSEILVSGYADGTVQVWDMFTGAWVQTLRGHTGEVRSVAVPLVVSGSADGSIQVWTWNGVTRSGFYTCDTLTGHTGPVNSVDVVFYDYEQVSIAGSDDGTIKIWDINTGKCRRTLIVTQGLC